MKNDKTKHKSQKFPPTFLLIFELGHFLKLQKNRTLFQTVTHSAAKMLMTLRKYIMLKKSFHGL